MKLINRIITGNKITILLFTTIPVIALVLSAEANGLILFSNEMIIGTLCYVCGSIMLIRYNRKITQNENTQNIGANFA